MASNHGHGPLFMLGKLVDSIEFLGQEIGDYLVQVLVKLSSLRSSDRAVHNGYLRSPWRCGDWCRWSLIILPFLERIRPRIMKLLLIEFLKQCKVAYIEGRTNSI